MHFKEFLLSLFFFLSDYFSHLTYSFQSSHYSDSDLLEVFCLLWFPISQPWESSTPGRFTQLYDHSLIHSLSKFLLSLYYVQSKVQGAENAAVEKKITVIIDHTVFGPSIEFWVSATKILNFQEPFVISECSFFTASYSGFWLHCLLLSL